MLGGGIIRNLDKHLLFQLHYQSQIIGNHRHLIKHRYPLLSIQNHFTNLLNSIIMKQILWGKNSDVKQFLQDNICGNRAAVSSLMEIFHISNDAAKDLVSKNPDLLSLTKKKIVGNYEALTSAGLNASLIYHHISLLSQDIDSLQKKLDIVQRFTHDIHEGIPFLYHSTAILSAFAKTKLIITKENLKQSQLKYFETYFGIKPRELYNILAKYIYYVVQDSEIVVEKLKLLLDYGVSVNSLINLNWPMYCSIKKMKIRLEQFSKSELLSPPRPWIFTCTELFFNSKVIKKTSKVKDKEERSKLLNFLSEKSGYDKTLILSQIKIARCEWPNFTEAKKIARTIKQKGYTYHDIIWSIKVLSLKNDFIKKRFDQLEIQKHKAPFLNVLLLSDKDFVNYINNLSKS